jgi:hypothetical protein
MQSSGQYDSVQFTALAAEDRAENSEVPKFQRESIRTPKNSFALWSRSKRFTRTPKMMGLESSLKEIARSTKLQECLGHVPDNFHKQHRAERKMMAIRVYRLQQEMKKGSGICAIVLRQWSQARSSRL